MSDWAKAVPVNPYNSEMLNCASERDAQSTGPLDLVQQVAQRYEELRDKIFFYLLAAGVSAADADELTQEAFVRLYLHMRGGGQTDNVRAWLYRVARNLITDVNRGRQRESGASDREWDQWETTLADASPDPEQKFLAQERSARMQRAMRGLTALQLECLHLRAEGLRYRQIAEMYGVTITAITDVVRRAVERIGKELE